MFDVGDGIYYGTPLFPFVSYTNTCPHYKVLPGGYMLLFRVNYIVCKQRMTLHIPLWMVVGSGIG